MKNTLDRDLVKDVFRAYFDARKNKRNTNNQLEFEMNFEHNLFALASEIQQRTYTIGRSICFIVNNPVKREIFAADFRDRVVHHLIFNRINPIVERQLISDCYSCRKGLGTAFGVERLQHHMRSVTNNHTREAYVLKLDIQGYFMSIDRRILWETVSQMLRKANNKGQLARYEETMYLLHKVIFNDPTEECRFKSSPKSWNDLPESKSLFHSEECCGLPIGNLTSQLFSNIYLQGFDNWVKRDLKMKHYGRYVDDFYVLHNDKSVLIEIKDRMTEYLKENYGLVVHPNKIYLQDINHGVTFLGAHIKPHRKYIRHRSLGVIRHNLRMVDHSIQERKGEILDNNELYVLRSRFNSYLGHLSQFKTYNIRKEMWKESTGYKRYFQINSNYKKISIKPKYLPYYTEDIPDDGFLGLFPDFDIINTP